jgi:calcineurin-like phosphoesterase family protein
MNTYLASDWHLNHRNIATYCRRPENFTELIVNRHNQTLTDNDVLIMLGDVAIGGANKNEHLIRSMRGRKVLIRGNHDRQHSCSWWMEHGFDFACDSLIFRGWWLTHEPANWRPDGCQGNIHGHLHNIWDDTQSEVTKERDKDILSLEPLKRLKFPWQRLFAIEYTDYFPVEFDKFVSHPDKYKARGPNADSGTHQV